VLYAQRPSAEELAEFGIRPEDLDADYQHEVWPENWRAVCLFVEMGTQWRVSDAGPFGLDYGPVFSRMERMALGDEWDETFDQVRVLEQAALEQMRKDRK
jgi:hypothetical protein